MENVLRKTLWSVFILLCCHFMSIYLKSFFTLMFSTIKLSISKDKPMFLNSKTYFFGTDTITKITGS